MTLQKIYICFNIRIIHNGSSKTLNVKWCKTFIYMCVCVCVRVCVDFVKKRHECRTYVYT